MVKRNKAQRIANKAVRKAGGKRGLGRGRFTAEPAVNKLKKKHKG